MAGRQQPPSLHWDGGQLPPGHLTPLISSSLALEDVLADQYSCWQVWREARGGGRKPRPSLTLDWGEQLMGGLTSL